MSHKNHFTILVPAYNVEKWARKNITSIVEQEFDNYDMIYIDDASTDNTHNIVKKIFEDYSRPSHTFQLITNSFNKGKMWNVYDAINTMKDETIVVIVDGDDWLKDPYILQKLDKNYDPGVWITAGSYIEYPSQRIINPKISDTYWVGSIRKKSWEASHLLSFRKKLFNKIKKKDLMNKAGEWFATTSDQAMVWPMLEMSGPAHYRTINDVLYVYNRINPLSDDKTNRHDQLFTESMIRSLSPYSAIEVL